MHSDIATTAVRDIAHHIELAIHSKPPSTTRRSWLAH
jgi:hypothetical protein